MGKDALSAGLNPAFPVPVPGQRGVSWWTSLWQKGKVIHCCCRLYCCCSCCCCCCCCQLLSRRFQHSVFFFGFRSLEFSLACGKTSFHFHAALSARATWFSSCVLRAAATAVVVALVVAVVTSIVVAAAGAAGAVARFSPLPTSCQGAFSTQLPFHLFLLSHFIKLLRHKPQDSQTDCQTVRQAGTVWVGGCTRKWAKWADGRVRDKCEKCNDHAIRFRASGLLLICCFFRKENAKLHLIIA